jgi:phospholipase/carboxylesterase
MTPYLDYEHIYLKGEALHSPTLLLLHGTGGTENDLVPLAQAMAPGAAILSPRGNVDENGMARFFERNADGTFDPALLEKRTRELATFIHAATKKYHLSKGNIVAIGYSNGANAIANLLLLGLQSFRASVLLHPRLTLEPKTPPSLRSQRLLVTIGQADTVIPPASAEALVNTLQACGATVDVERSPGGHRITDEEIALASAWLQKRLAGE